jgi:hypothetical protein
VLLRDQHPVEPGEAIGLHFPLKLLRHLKFGLPAQFPGNNLAGPFADAMGDIIAGNVEGLAVVGNAPNEDMGVGVAGVVVIDRDPVELGPEVGFHLLHQIAGRLARIGKVHAVLGRDDETELVPVIAAPVEKGTAVLHIALGRIDLALLSVTGHAVAFEIAQVCVDRSGADELAAARGSALRVELHHASLHRNATRPCARAAPVPAPRAPILERQRRCSTPPTRIEPAASLAGPTRAVGIAARPTYGLTDLAEKAGRASAHLAEPACTCPCTAMIADLAGTDAEVVFVACHETTIGG